MPVAANGAAAHTASDLDAMDDKLRRLGLDVAHANAPAGATSGQSNEDYLRRIRAAKNDKRQAEADRLSRQALAAEKHHTVHTATKHKTAPSLAETMAADRALLTSDAAEAAMRVRQDYDDTTTRRIQAERAANAAKHQQQQQHRESLSLHMPASAPGGSQSTLSPPSTQAYTLLSTAAEGTGWAAPNATARRAANRRAVLPWCAEVARGVAELAMEVSDNRHLPSTGLSGRPVCRLQQDLGVTQWREWVERLVFARAAEAVAAAEAAARAAEADGDRLGESADAAAERAAAAALAQAEADGAALRREALRCVEAAAQAEAEVAVDAQHAAVASVLATLHGEVAKHRRAAEEAVRREADEPQLTTAPEQDGGGGTALVGVRREEVLPGWAQRMPPAACCVFGDALSGARLLSDTVELCLQRRLAAAQQPPPPHTAATATASGTAAAPAKASHHAAAAAVEPADDPTRPNSVDGADGSAAGAAPPSAAVDPLAHFTATEVGIEDSGAAVEGGVRVTYITPKTLLGSISSAAAGGDGKRSGSASRQPRGQAHGSTNAAAATGGTGSVVGSGGSAGRGGRRASAAVGDGRRGLEQQLVEAATKEVLRVHRHNLSVLVGDALPGFALLPPPAAPPASGAPAAVDAAEGGGEASAGALEAAPRPPLQSLFLLGFPESPSFAEAFADRLRSATAALETELLEAEARRRAAVHQAAATAAAEASRPRSPSMKSAKGAGNASSRQKANRAPKAVAEAEDGTVAALVDQLRLTFALPPLSVLAVFLAYDVPTRQRRLEAAAYAAEPPAKAPGESAEEELNATLSAVGAGGDCVHPVYHPWRAEEKEALPSVTSSFRRPAGTAAAAAPAAAATVPLHFASAAVLPSGYERYLDASSVSGLRGELEQQHARQQQQQQGWGTAVTAALVRRSAEAGELRRGPASFYAAGKRRDKSPAAGAAADDAKSGSPSQRGSLNATPAKGTGDAATTAAGAAAAAAAAPPPPPTLLVGAAGTVEPLGRGAVAARLLPRALFFSRVLDVSDATAPTSAAVDAAADAHALGRAVWRSSGAAAHTPSALTEQLSVTARAATVDHILTQVHLLCRPAGGRALSSDALVPQQLVEPFRLGDYRLSDAVCARLRQVREAYASLLPEPSSVATAGRSDRQGGSDAVLWAASEAIAAEAEAWGAVRHYADDLFSLLAFEVFPDNGAAHHAGGDGARKAASMLSSTAHFTGIDQSYVRAKDAITQRSARGVAQVQDCLALLLRYSLDVCVAQFASAVRLFCSLLGRPAQQPRGTAHRPSGSEASDVEAQLLASVPGLPEGVARELLGQLQAAWSQGHDVAALETLLADRLSQVYWPQVRAAAVEVVAAFFHPAGGGDALAETMVMEGPGGDDPLDASCSTVLPTVSVTSEGHLAAVVARLLEHAVASPAPLSRLALLLHEFQRSTHALRDGAEAWVELLYHEVLATRPGSTAGQPQPEVPLRRPTSVEELADGPSGTSSQLSPWRCGELEVFLNTMPPPDSAGLVSAAAFQRGLWLNQLPRLWRYLPDRAAELAEQVGYTVGSSGSSGDHGDTTLVSRRTSLTAETLGALPDTGLDAYLVHDCPCRPLLERLAVPFLTVEDVQCLTDCAAGPQKTAAAAAASAPRLLLPLSQWLVDVALGRCCFCGDATHCAAPPTRDGVSATASVSFSAHAAPSRRATRRVVPLPSTRALRQTLLTLPPSVLQQVSTLGMQETAPPQQQLQTATTVATMCDGWLDTQWWWNHEAPCGPASNAAEEQPIAARTNAALCWTLWRILRSPVLLRPSAATPPPAASVPLDAEADVVADPPACAVPVVVDAVVATVAPSLLSLMRHALIGSGGSGGHSAEERVRRAFHCLAALRCISEGKGEEHIAADGSVAVVIEDTMTLTAEECRLLGALLTPPASPPLSSGSSSSSAGGAVCVAGKGIADLMTDVQLLMQVEGTDAVSLPLLLSSRWSQLLLAAHF